MKANQVIKLRTRLGMTQKEFSKILAVEPRSVTRWESGEAEPQGTALSLMNAFTLVLDTHDEDQQKQIVEFIQQSNIGGLGYLFVRLFEYFYLRK